MMTWYLRRLAGLTSFISKRCWSHRSAMGPAGTRPSGPGPSASTQRAGALVRRGPPERSGAMVMLILVSWSYSVNGSGQHAERYRHEAQDHHDGDDGGGPPDEQIPPPVVDPEGLKDAPGPVVDVQTQRDHGCDINDDQPPLIEVADDVVVHPAAYVGVARMEPAPGEVGQVEHDEQADGDSAPPHRYRRDVGLDVVDALVTELTSPAAPERQVDC